MTDLQARLRHNRQTQSNVASLIAQFADEPKTVEVMMFSYMALVDQAAEIERQLLAADKA